MDVCIIVGAGALYRHKPKPKPGSLVIAADGGYAHLKKLSIRADAVIGDFDSLAERPQGIPLIELPREKDDTDMLAAIRHGLVQSCREFHIYGGAGGRFDHTIANLQCLTHLAHLGCQGFLYGKNCVMTCLHNSQLEIPGGHKGIVSVFAHSGTAEGVFLQGLKYELHDATLRMDFPLGVSNELTGAPARIAVRDGTLLVIAPCGVF